MSDDSDLGLRCPHMPEGMFSHGAAQMQMALNVLANDIVLLEENDNLLFPLSFLFKYLHCK